MGNKRTIFFLVLCLIFAVCASAQTTDSTSTKTIAGSSTPAGTDKKNDNLSLFGGGQKDGKPKGPTIVTATNDATFNSKTHTATFTGDVQVQDPQFSLRCDKLTVYLNDNDQGGLRESVAEGNVFIVSIHKGENGQPDERSTGKGEKSVYTTKDGKMILSGWPQIQKGLNLHIATAESTVMRLYNDGRLETDGPTRTVIQNNNSSKKPAAGATASSSPTPSASNAQ